MPAFGGGGFGGTADETILSLVVQAEDRASSVLEAIGEHATRTRDKLKELALGFGAGALGFAAFSEALGGVDALGKGLIETNATAETLTQTFAALYRSGPEAQQAVAWITQFALTAPFTRQSIMQAGVAIASIGGNITEVLPSLGNLASVMGTDMPTAARALTDAFEGRFAMMQNDLHVTKQQLEQFGLVVQHNGHVIQSTLIPAFERFVAARYPNGMALQMGTFTGQMSNLEDQFQNIERIMGRGVFVALKKELLDLIGYLGSHQGQVAAFAEAVGSVLAGALGLAVGAFRALWAVAPTVIGALISLWNAARTPIAAAIAFVANAAGAMATFLRNQVLPAVESVLGNMAIWWHDHAEQVRKVLSTIGEFLGGFGKQAGAWAVSFFTAFSGLWAVGWNLAAGIVSVVIDTISGNWGKLGQDLRNMAAGIVDGMIRIFEGLVDAVIALLPAITGPINAIGHAAHDLTQNVAGAIFDTFASLPSQMLGAIANLVQDLPKIADAFGQVANNIYKMFLGIPGAVFSAIAQIVSGLPAFGKALVTEAEAIGKSITDAIGNLNPFASHQRVENAGQHAVSTVHAFMAQQQRQAQDTMRQLGTPQGAQGWFDQRAAGIRSLADGLRPTAADRAAFVRTLSLGWGADQTLSFGKTPAQAQADLHQTVDGWIKGINGFLGAKPGGALGLQGGDAQGIGKGILDGFLRGLGGTAFSFGKTPNMSAFGPLPGAGGLPVVGFNPTADPSLAKGPLANDQAQFEVDRLEHASMPVLLRDINRILADMKAAGDSRIVIRLEQLRLLAEITKATGASAAYHLAQASGLGHSAFGYARRSTPGAAAAFGDVSLAFGGVSSNDASARLAALESANASLQRQLAAAMDRAAHDERALTIAGQQLAAQRGTEQGVATLGSRLAGAAGRVHPDLSRYGTGRPYHS